MPVDHSERARRRCGRGAFTVIEVLVVVGIIGVLMAILLPALSRARRAAQVLASPVAYVGQDNRTHLTDHAGRTDLPLTPAAKAACPVCHTPPVWSPSGLLLGLRVTDASNRSFTAIVNPVSKATQQHAEGTDSFVGWMDSTKYIEAYRGNLFIVNAATGDQTSIPNASNVLFISPNSPSAPQPFVATVYGSAGDTITFLKGDLSRGKPVWTEKGATPGTQSQMSPRCDPFGEYVAWTLVRKGRAYAAMKAARELSSKEPDLIGDGYQQAYFCDWTEGGDLLCNVQDSLGRHLVIFDREGNVKKTLGLEVPPADGVVASWRKYQHR